MKDFIDIVADTIRDRNASERDDILLHVEQLYFNHIRDPKRYGALSLGTSLEVAQDIINLQNAIDNFNSIKGVPIVSDLIVNAVELVSKDRNCLNIRELPEIGETQMRYLNMRVLGRYRYYVTAVMLAELIKDEQRKARNDQWLKYIIPIITALLGTAIALLTKW